MAVRAAKVLRVARAMARAVEMRWPRARARTPGAHTPRARARELIFLMVMAVVSGRWS